MKHLIPLFILLLTLGSCTNEEGLGGSSSIEGYVYSVYVYDDLKKDTFPACDEKIQILFGNSENPGDDVDTGPTGKYKFDYLREGNYTLCAYYKMRVNDRPVPVMTSVKVSGNNHTYKADTLYIFDGKSVGMTYLTGTIIAQFYDKSGDLLREVPSFDQVRVYIEDKADFSSLQDVRTNANGQFMFSRLQPGEYRLSVARELADETVVPVSFDITISEDFKITYDDTEMDGHDIGSIKVRINV